MCGEGMFEWPRTEGPALALELLASEAAAAAAAFSARRLRASCPGEHCPQGDNVSLLDDDARLRTPRAS